MAQGVQMLWEEAMLVKVRDVAGRYQGERKKWRVKGLGTGTPDREMSGSGCWWMHYEEETRDEGMVNKRGGERSGS